MFSNKKLFGKLNILDIIIILVIIAVAAYVGFKLLGTSETAPADKIEVYYEVTIDVMPKELWEEVSSKLPAQMVYSGGSLDAYVLSGTASPRIVERFEAKEPYNWNANYTVIPEEGREFVSVVISCKAILNKNSLLRELGTQEIRTGRMHIVKFREVEIVGSITKVTVADE